MRITTEIVYHPACFSAVLISRLLTNTSAYSKTPQLSKSHGARRAVLFLKNEIIVRIKP